MDLAALQADSERVSRVYAARFAIDRTDEWLLLKLQEEVGELTSAALALSGQGRPRGRTPAELRTALEDELADVLAQVLLLAERHGVDLAAVTTRKWLTHLPPA